jgi:UDP-N-acetylmuramoyl-tripeptide--D-alanyl-D-alanine ligase
MLFATNELMELFQNHLGAVQDEISIMEVETDSRKQTNKALFIPLIGESFDGHTFIKQAFDNGAVACIWQKDKEIPKFLPTDFPVFLVDDTLEALQQLSHWYRRKVDPIVIGITGSNGKTTTKDLVSAVLRTHYKVHKTQGNYNNHIGLPLTILAMNPDTEVLVLEMGMNHFGEIEQLSLIAEPNYGVITNIGESHIEYLGSREGIAQAKTEIFAGLKAEGLLLIDGDEPLLEALHSRDKVISCGFGETNDIIVHNISMSANTTSFTLNQEKNFQVNMLGSHNAKNATFAITLGELLHVPDEKINQALIDITLTGMRFEIVEGINGSTIINDTYNASPTSMKASIEVIVKMQPYDNKILVLGDMFELGQDSKRFHRDVAEAITEDIDVVFTIGTDTYEITEELTNRDIPAKHFKSKDQLLNQLTPYLNDKTLLLLKASRGMKLESLLEKITV